jgi:alpha-beta hydrolase superfamily lysophospholipase
LSDAFTLETCRASDGYAWRYRRYAAEAPRGHVVFLHGIQSHAGWYDFSCRRIQQAGWTVSFLDRRGSGLNQEQRGDAPSFRRLLDDLVELLQAQSIRPVCLAGISWGGKLVLALKKYHPGLADRLALLCPGLFPKVRPSFREKLAIAASRLYAPTRGFPIPLNDAELFTASKQWQEFIRHDPLALHEATARLLVESARLDIYLRFVPRCVNVPVLLLLAEHDRIIDNRRTRSYIESFATPDKQVIEYAGAHHTLEFEPEPARHVDDLLNWLSAGASVK